MRHCGDKALVELLRLALAFQCLTQGGSTVGNGVFQLLLVFLQRLVGALGLAHVGKHLPGQDCAGGHDA